MRGTQRPEGLPEGSLSPPSITISGAFTSPKMVETHPTSLKLSPPFLHPTISRLRSTTPQASRIPSNDSVGTLYSHTREDESGEPSHFSALSRTSSSLHLLASPAIGDSKQDISRNHDVFRWTQLRVIDEYLYSNQPQKASALLGTQSPGSPTVLAANGLICIGTDTGKVLVFDFQQKLRCICGSESPDRTVGPVTALALSFDHTYVAAGHATGHIQLFDLNAPKTPARFVPPTSLAAVASGRQEGHLAGSRIVSVGFVAGRHTAVVSADDYGLAFYHTLGKILFVEASDVLRILGKYPEEDPVLTPPTAPPGSHPFRRRRSRKAGSILAMAPLPLGTASHETDAYNLIALLTPVKLVVVGLRPSPRTWYRKHRDADEVSSKSRFKGCLAWFPSVVPGAGSQSAPERTSQKTQSNGLNVAPTTPMLVYSWGSTMSLIRVSESRVMEQTRNAKTGKITSAEVGRITFEEVGSWSTDSDILALRWLNVNQVIVLIGHHLEVYDVRTFKLIERVGYDSWTLVSPTLSHTTNGSVSYTDAVTEVAHSLRVYKGKIFILGQHGLQVGTLLTWADRILSFVQNGDFLSAIELTRSYYLGQAPGNRNGLPDSPEKLKEVVGEKMRELMTASARYTFSEDRMTDGTHITADGRGVDRTSLFEGLVRTCARACMALDDYEFLFEDLFQYYDDNSISRIFLLQLEPFILDGTIRHVPPRITQQLIALHDFDNNPGLAERIIWHIDPDCLDINQAIALCRKHRLYDALIYVFTRALNDYVSPIVELLGLIRQVQQYRRARMEASPDSGVYVEGEAIEGTVMNAYKIYPYLADVLTGLTYPSEDPIPKDEAEQARNDVYTFVFFGRSSVWPEGEGGTLVLTSDEENGVEPTYPYTRLLLRFDPEAFLHTLDLAFEDAYLNDEDRAVSRLVIVKILLEILASPELTPSERTFVHIFIARNVPKYPQFIEIPPSALHSILIGLAEDPDQSTREDRQLAAEYLLSVYTPHESDRILALFEEAGFYRILRSWYRQENRWRPLYTTFLQDPNLPSSTLFPSLDDLFQVARRKNKGMLPKDLVDVVSNSLPTLIHVNIRGTAALIDKHLPDFHERAIQSFSPDEDRERFAYLHYLLGSPQSFQDADVEPPREGGPSPHITPDLRQLYISLHCLFDPTGVIPALRYLPHDFLDTPAIVETCESHRVYDAAIWLLDREGDSPAALAKAESYEKALSVRIAVTLVSEPLAEQDIWDFVHSLESIARTAVSICLEHSKVDSDTNFPLGDIWFRLLKSQLDSVQRVVSCRPPTLDSATSDMSEVSRQVTSSLRSILQSTFGSLMSTSSTRGISLPRLFKRLVESVQGNQASKGALYAEFRTILTGMLESYRSDGDMLIITKHLVDRDLFENIEEFALQRVRGWAPSQGICFYCGESFINKVQVTTNGGPEYVDESPVIVSRTGAIYHSRCSPPDTPANTLNVH
ncbi:hypothetical protein OBBRIDRAFT_724115 [Obba rivulosa]|uniref:Vacuolar protein sorting-associated protein 8 central domain-containing protein n=1 Tax=Obba rivulosa TaxID=1052685 RepID=A0A8E2DQ82_9APHY|nr:hypothetical protein OBBRIDRAFT_724115 [Obba rivulosa]